MDELILEKSAPITFKSSPIRIPDVQHINTSEPVDSANQLDLITNAWIGRFTGNISPAALINAYNDWLTHLRLSPSKKAELTNKALKKFWRWTTYACDPAQMLPSFNNESQHCITPLPQDKRFIDKAWENWPFNVMTQGFLLNQQWWHNATTNVRGVSQHHEDVVTFTTRQILDMWAPSNFLLTNPVVLKQTMREGGANLLRGAQNAFADWQRSSGAGSDSTSAFKVGENLAVTPGKVIYRNRLIELIQYSPSTESVHAVPVLIVPAWIMKYYILDLSAQNSLVNYLVEQGHTVFMISWKNPDASDRDLSMDDYHNLGVMEAIDTVSRVTGAEQINSVGYCLGGTLLSIAAAAMARDGDTRLASITLFAAQVDFTEPGEMSLFIDESQISFLEAVMWEQGYLDSTQMAGAFQLLRSNDLIWSHRLNQYLLGMKETESDLMAWNADATRMPYRMHTEYLRHLFLHNDLAEGRYRVNSKVVNLTDIHVPIFAVGTTTDHVAPWHSVFKIQRLTEAELTFLLTSGGHNAGVVSPPGHPHRSYQVATRAQGDAVVDADTWQTTLPVHEGSWWPTWEAWLASRSGQSIKPPAINNPICDAPGVYIMQK
ncbi:PHA/PHB synthase family protein [Solimicrobium silvestre]|uniref:Poly(3-hydroxyalkanoate) synthetase n=1 Tax=Solimicrobium silvestre TaxID=2099400 RepID=A0A2S9H0G0_9BURK|nr:alpha/beta fold hydrolase [Solimicrobium silvestre]PRC93474.1 Poly(3-hydroxyalkanoate) synthetase [Solimicrobium silvestre]